MDEREGARVRRRRRSSLVLPGFRLGNEVRDQGRTLVVEPLEGAAAGRRADGVEKALAELLRKRMSRVAKLAAPEKPRGVAQARVIPVEILCRSRRR